ncbi:stalk domain-containing protein [Pseudobacteroides cellulosolvens]|uniref:Copper amine oxidase-like domain-containing protein n=1 Tax=Pseudobacteroides cellulosolvens ATCC 35603 = DSM 2933 TaxID=398512 RepID=A0A0L6JJL6_9FIRM|nr:copper amine oxidase N-terminal domain-containing protein [Pseudobacteroides cellulosolvens]KNY25949.1 copper amine oxidase-like domain-containing protein [Pseudobacteroides cellulosolvens ATCC 35603 = DSM 2933]
MYIWCFCKYFSNYKIKLEKLTPGEYEFLLKTSGDYRPQIFLRRFKFTIPDTSINSPESDNIKIDLDVYKRGKEYDDIKREIVDNSDKTVICVPLVFKDNEVYNKQDQELSIFVYDEEGNEVSKITDFESTEFTNIPSSDEKLKQNTYKYLRMNYASLVLPLNKLYHIKAVYKANGKEYIKDVKYHNIDVLSLKEEIGTNTEYICVLNKTYSVKKYTYDIKVNINKNDSCDTYELYRQPFNGSPVNRDPFDEKSPLIMKSPDFIYGINEFISDLNRGENCYYVVLGKKGDKYVSRSKVFQVDKKIKILRDHSYINTDTDPVIVNDRVLIPIRVVTESLGGVVNWNNKTKTVSIQIKSNDGSKALNKIEFKIGSKVSKVNGVQKSMDVSPAIINNRTYIPLRFLTENIKLHINWDEYTKTVELF